MSESVIHMSELTRRFGSTTALDSVSLSLPRGAVYGLVGANGAGKTTLIKHILGLLKADSGVVRVFGIDPVDDPVGVLSRTKNWARRNQCDEHPVDSVIAVDVIRRDYTKCRNDAAVVLYTIIEGGHTWPGGTPMPEWFVGTTTNSVDATSELWKFFQSHPLSRNAQRP